MEPAASAFGQNMSKKKLEDGGVIVEHVEGMEQQILEVSMAGHHE